MIEKKVLHDLKSGMVLDRSMLINADSFNIGHSIQAIRAAGDKPLYVIDGAAQFFIPSMLIELILGNDERYLVCNEALNGFFTQDQMTALLNNHLPPGAGVVIKPAAVVEDNLIVHMDAAPIKEELGYVFAPVPPGWTVSGAMSLGPTRIKRKVKNADGDGTLFFMSPLDFEKLWLFAAKAWAGIEGAPLQSSFMTGQGKLKATVQDDRIAMGGNYIRRYEIEQIAKYRNWALPALQAA